MRVLVFGNSGSGKSTYAQALAAREGLVRLDLDSIIWDPGKIGVQRSLECVAKSLEDFTARCLGYRGVLQRTGTSSVSPLHAIDLSQPGVECVPRK